MERFDPIKHVERSEEILESYGSWPNFHDAEVYLIKFWRGDMRPDDDIWVGPVIEASLELAVVERSFVVDFKFHDCDFIEMSGFNHDNMIFGLNFAFEERGYFADDVTPLPPYICVEFEQSFGMSLKFKCFRIEVIGCRESKRPTGCAERRFKSAAPQESPQ